MKKTFLALLLVSTSVFSAEYLNFGETKEYKIDLDIDSVIISREPSVVIGGIVKRTLHKEVDILSQKGAYYLDKILIDCKADTITIVTAELYRKDDVKIADSEDVGTMKNPNRRGTFVTEIIRTMCNAAKNSVPRFTT